MMNLKSKINLFFIVQSTTLFIILILFYSIIINNIEKNKSSIIASKYDEIFDANYPFFIRYLSENKKLFQYNLELLSAKYRVDELNFEFIESNSSFKFNTNNSNLLTYPINISTLHWTKVNNYLWKKFEIKFANRYFGILILSININSDKYNYLNYYFQITIILFLIASVFNILFFRFLMLKEVLKPMNKLLKSLPVFGDYIKGNCVLNDVYVLEKEIKSNEFKSVFQALSDFSSKLKNSINKEYESKINLEKEITIRKTVEMMAHDIRKPFGILKTLIMSLKNKSQEQINKIIPIHLETINKSILYLDTLTKDIMDLQKNFQSINFEPTNYISIISESLLQIFMLHKKAKIEFIYTFNSYNSIYVLPDKVSRIFNNIISNALEAMNGTGVIWFRTENIEIDKKKYVEFYIKNSNSFINTDELEDVFNYSFTKNKRFGNGLGLSIVKKFIEMHGGKIHCTSDGKNLVEFIFTLPAFEYEILIENNLPKNTDEIYKNIQFNSYQLEESISYYEEKFKNILNDKIVKLNILVVENELYYINHIKNLLSEINYLKEFINLKYLQNSNNYLSEIESYKYQNIIILDIDLGHNSISGLDILDDLRKRGFDGTICVHSNNASSYVFKEAIQKGADVVFLKPMTHHNFLKLLETYFNT